MMWLNLIFRVFNFLVAVVFNIHDRIIFKPPCQEEGNFRQCDDLLKSEAIRLSYLYYYPIVIICFCNQATYFHIFKTKPKNRKKVSRTWEKCHSYRKYRFELSVLLDVPSGTSPVNLMPFDSVTFCYGRFPCWVIWWWDVVKISGCAFFTILLVHSTILKW